MQQKLTKKQKIATSLIALTFVLGGAIMATAIPVYAKVDTETRTYFNQIKEAIHEAIANGDYEAFQQIASQTPFGENISEETFAKLVEAYNLREAGDHDTAHEIMQEIGMPHFGHHAWSDEAFSERQDRKEEIRSAIENDDYDAWLALVEGKPITNVINEDNFGDYTAAFDLRESGDIEGFKEALADLGIEMPPREGRMGHMGMMGRRGF